MKGSQATIRLLTLPITPFSLVAAVRTFSRGTSLLIVFKQHGEYYEVAKPAIRRRLGSSIRACLPKRNLTSRKTGGASLPGKARCIIHSVQTSGLCLHFREINKWTWSFLLTY